VQYAITDVPLNKSIDFAIQVATRYIVSHAQQQKVHFVLPAVGASSAHREQAIKLRFLLRVRDGETCFSRLEIRFVQPIHPFIVDPMRNRIGRPLRTSQPKSFDAMGVLSAAAKGMTSSA
jgi:hypothetical protein